MVPPAVEAVELTAVVKRFSRTGPPALDGISAVLRAGEITGLVGPDGAGKTTLIRLMTGLMVPDHGQITVLGWDTGREAARIQTEIGYMPQRFGLYEDLTVLENLRLYAELRGLAPAEQSATFERLLHFTDLGRFTTRLAGHLSGGMKQKLGLACALLKTPRLLLLDEPGVGVDPISRRDLWAMVEALAGEGIGVVWSTAYLEEAEACRRVLLLDRGRLLFAGPPAELTESLAGRVVRLVGSTGQRRQALVRALDDPAVIDGVIQGESLRLVTAPGAVPGAATLSGGRLEPAVPRFEDAYVSLLGGGPGGASPLAGAVSLAADPGVAEPVIEARGLTKRFGDFVAADSISFAVPRGEIFGLLGPNGAGKSTTFRMLCGLLSPSAGEGRVAGRDLRREPAEARRSLGYMAQKFSLYGDLSVAQNLAFFAGLYGLAGARRRQQIALMSEIFDLGPYRRQSARDLPLGLKQRLALACAVMHQPAALFLDEPTSGVDPITRREFWSHINALVETGVTVLVTTHFMEEAEYCDRIALIDRGRLLALASPDMLKARAVALGAVKPTMEEAFVALVQAGESAR